jgi:hypothetical protein
VNRGFRIELVTQGSGVAEGRGGSLYTVKFTGESMTELDKFVNCRQCEAFEEFESMLVRLDYMAEEVGFVEQFFKQEKYRHVAPTCAYHEFGMLRMYCCRYGKVALIAGDGGPKLTQTIQDDPTLLRAFTSMVYVGRRVDERIRQRELIVTDWGIAGESEAFIFDTE